MSLSGHGIDLRFQLGAQRSGVAVQLEVDARIIGRDLHAGDPSVIVAECDGVEDVQHRVIAREREAPLVVDAEPRSLAYEVDTRRAPDRMPDDLVRVRVYGFDRER